jgi:hypothetical protein
MTALTHQLVHVRLEDQPPLPHDRPPAVACPATVGCHLQSAPQNLIAIAHSPTVSPVETAICNVNTWGVIDVTLAFGTTGDVNAWGVTDLHML